MAFQARLAALSAVTLVSLAIAPRADDLDTFVRVQMSEQQINSLSLAIIQDGRIDARAYGLMAPSSSSPSR